MEPTNINQTDELTEPVAEKKSAKCMAGLLGRFDAAGETGIKKLLFNMPFVLFLVVLAALHIANNHMAENYARNIAKTEKEVKQLRWQYMTTTSSLMQKSKQSEVARLVGTQGLKELRIPPYKIEVTKN
jgi:uncharacterized membrane protein YtjA (UPF0391 family)